MGPARHRRFVTPETRRRRWTRRGVMAALVLTGLSVILLKACVL